MDNLQTIIEPLKEELDNFRRQLREAMSGHSGKFQPMLDYIAQGSGKHIRPILLLLSAKLCGGINQRSIDYGVILELLHTTTLVHDDVVDNTMQRRGRPSANAEFDNRMAVLLGDYILTLAIGRAVKVGNQHALDLLSKLSKDIVEGEIVQLISSKEQTISEKRYFEIIRKKTALLLSSSTEMGALSAEANPEDTNRLREIGEKLGLIFQIKDDIFDYFEQGEIGKPTGNDIREGKITLPLIYALNNSPREQSDAMHRIISQQDFTPENIHALIEFAKKYNGIEYANDKMQELKVQTIGLLDHFPDGDAKTAMIRVVDFIIDRKK